MSSIGESPKWGPGNLGHLIDNNAIDFPSTEIKGTHFLNRVWKVIKDFTVLNVDKLIAFVAKIFNCSVRKQPDCSASTTVGAMAKLSSLSNLNTEVLEYEESIKQLKFNSIENLSGLCILINNLLIANNELAAISLDEELKTFLKTPANAKQLRQIKAKLGELSKQLSTAINKNHVAIKTLISGSVDYLTSQGRARKSAKEKEAKSEVESGRKEAESKGEAEGAVALKPKNEQDPVFQELFKVLDILTFLSDKKVLSANSKPQDLMALSRTILTRLTEFSGRDQHVAKFFGINKGARAARGLYNLNNSCYINAGFKLLSGVLPALLSRPLTRQTVAEHGTYDETAQNFQRRQNIQASLTSVFNALQEENNENLMVALYGLRFDLLESGLNAELVCEKIGDVPGAQGYSRQHDGATLLGCILEALEYSVPSQTFRTIMHAGVERTRGEPIINQRTLLLSIPKQSRGKSHVFQELFLSQYSRQAPVKDFDNPLRIPIEGEDQPRLFVESSVQARIVGAPQNLFFQIMRFAQEPLPLNSVKLEEVRATAERLEKEQGEREIARLQGLGLSPEEARLGMQAKFRQTALNRVQRGRDIKIMDAILFPPRGLVDLAVAFGSGTPVPYRVVGFEQHRGNSVDHGHYVTYLHHEGEGWYCHNDADVSRVTEKELELAFHSAYNVSLSREPASV